MNPLSTLAVGAVAHTGGDDTAGSALPHSPLSGTVYAIVNPVAGRGRGHRMWSVIRDLLGSASVDFREVIAQRPGQARGAAEQAALAGAGLIVAIGGDGTLHEALNGVMVLPPAQRPAVAFVPGGTANIFARALRLPTSARDVGDLLRRGVRKRIDVGQVNDRYYATIAGMGFDAEVVGWASRWPRWGGGKTRHVAGVLVTLVGYRPPAVELSLDGRQLTIPLSFLAVANTDWYGGGLHIAPGARADDGKLMVVYGAGFSRMDTLSVIMRAFAGRHLDHPKVAHTAATRVRVESAEPLAIHADGEWLGRGQATFRVVPAALDVIVPAGPDRTERGEARS